MALDGKGACACAQIKDLGMGRAWTIQVGSKCNHKGPCKWGVRESVKEDNAMTYPRGGGWILRMEERATAKNTSGH